MKFLLTARWHRKKILEWTVMWILIADVDTSSFTSSSPIIAAMLAKTIPPTRSAASTASSYKTPDCSRAVLLSIFFWDMLLASRDPHVIVFFFSFNLVPYQSFVTSLTEFYDLYQHRAT